MKKIICMLLMLLFAFPALAEGAPLAEEAPLAEASPFAPFEMTAPPAVTLEENEGKLTYVYGRTRVVAMVIDRVPDEKPAEAIIRMMAQFEPKAVIGEDLSMAEGYVGISARNEDKFDEGVDLITVMVLSSTGALLILSGYDLNGDEEQVQQLLDTLLASLTVDGSRIVTAKE